MSNLSHSSSGWMLSLKVGILCVSVLCAGLMLKLYQPVVMKFAYSDIPSIWGFVILWLRPPYLYVVINGIIITIVASSKLQRREVMFETPPETVAVPSVPVKVKPDHEAVCEGVNNLPLEARPELVLSHGYDIGKTSAYDSYESVNTALPEIETKMMTSSLNPEMENKLLTTVDANAEEEETSREAQLAISRPLWTPNQNSMADSISFHQRPPVSVRIGHRKAVKPNSEGGRALRVSKPKRQETLESTWKTITEGRPMPLTRHLRKSDTWETHGRRHVPDHHTDPKMTKSETFQGHPADTAGAGRIISSENLSPASGKLRKEPSGSWKLKKEPSPGQDELNRRVEAFINKFNEEMRLQRQESLNRYLEMINRGAH